LTVKGTVGLPLSTVSFLGRGVLVASGRGSAPRPGSARRRATVYGPGGSNFVVPHNVQEMVYRITYYDVTTFHEHTCGTLPLSECPGPDPVRHPVFGSVRLK
jgi:hypothetical protein